MKIFKKLFIRERNSLNSVVTLRQSPTKFTFNSIMCHSTTSLSTCANCTATMRRQQNNKNITTKCKDNNKMNYGYSQETLTNKMQQRGGAQWKWLLFSRIITRKGPLLFLLLLLTALITPHSAHDPPSSSVTSTSVHRFSNLYGSSLSCADFLSSPNFLSTHSSDSHRGSTSSSSPSAPFTISGIPFDLRSLLRSHLLNYDGGAGPPSHHAPHHGGRFNITIRWQVRPVPSYRSGSSSSSSSSSNRAASYEYAHDRAGLRYANPLDGTLSFAPFEVGSFQPDVHDAFYRCLLHLPQGILASREVRVQAVVEKLRPKMSSSNSKQQSPSSANRPSYASDDHGQAEEHSSSSSSVYVRSVNSSEVTEGSDAVLRCDFDRHNSLFEVAAWLRDDGKIFLPLEKMVDSIKRSMGVLGAGGQESFVNYTALRHFIQPTTGDLLISSVRFRDTKHRYRCQVRHSITNVRVNAATWAYIRLKDISELYLSGPRLNAQLTSRHTVAVNEGDTAFFYCSFDGHPRPVIEWYHSDIGSLTRAATTAPYFSSIAQYSSSNSAASAFLSQPPSSSQQQWSWSSVSSSLPNDQSQSSSVYLYGRNFLAIERVTAEDTGIISCVANNSNSLVRHEMLLFVKSSIQVSLAATSSNPYPGQEITLSCNLSTNSAFPVPLSAFGPSGSSGPDPSSSTATTTGDEQSKRLRELISSHFLLNINWFHNGRPISFNHRKRRSAEESLVIADFRGPEDNGLYQCSVRLTAPDYDEESFMAAQFIKTIERAPELTSVFTDQIKLADKRDSLSLKCSAEGVPLPSIRWFLDGVELYSNSHVRIESFTESLHPPIVSSGGSGPGASSGASAAVASSMKAHHLSRSIISFVNISSLLLQDIGIYECIASNYLGTVSHRARINQMGSPYVKPIANQTAVLGQPFTLNCTYGGYPLEEVFFIKGRSTSGKSSSSQQVASLQHKRMPFDERHLVPLLGSITISPVERSDQDYYRCVVVTSNGERAEQEFYLNVVVAPVVSPIVFSNNLEEGHRGSAVCTVTSGDSPMDITWLKDGVPLRDQMSIKRGGHGGRNADSSSTSPSPERIDHIQIVQIANFMSTLTIANISRQHQGLYTCVASSPVATTNVSAFLSVRAAPQWRLRPADRNAIAGDSLTLDCQTAGQPAPVTRWKFLKNEPYHTEPNPILSSQQIHVLENGSLYLRALEPKHTGIYICDASNGVNKSPFEARAHVTVTNLPKVSVQNTLGSSSTSSGSSSSSSSASSGSFRGHGALERLVLRKGAQTQLMCSALGSELPMTAEWLRPNAGSHPLEGDPRDSHQGPKPSFAESRIVLREETKLNEKRAYLYISHLTRADSGVYGCLATNVNGHSVAFIELRVQEPPDQPVEFRAQEISSRTITLTWAIAFTGNAPITSYVVEYRDRALTVGGLEASENDIALGGQTNTVLTAKSLTTSISITGLSPLSTYEFRVCAYNELGASPFTEPLILTTEMEAPSLIPAELRTHVLNSHSIRLIWSATLSTATEQIDGFYIGYRPLATGGPDSIDANSGKLDGGSKSSSGSMPAYTFKTMYDLARSSLANGSANDNSEAIRASSNMTTFCEVISAEGGAGFKKGPSEQHQKSAKFQQKGSNKNGPKREQIRCTYEFVVHSLTRKTRYGFIVQAFNAKGAGPTSTEVYAQTLMKDPPSKPYVRLYNVSSYEASILWSTAADPLESSADQVDSSSGTSIDGFIISYRALTRKSVFDGSPELAPESASTAVGSSPLEPMKNGAAGTSWESISVSASTKGYTLRSLRCGTSYRLRVEAFNEMGSGEQSDTLEFATLGRVPIPPANSNFIQPNITFVLLDLDRWTSPSLCPLSHFSIRYRVKDLSASRPEENTHSWITVSSHIKPEHGAMYVIRELLPATWYELSVIATNEAGDTESRYLFATLTLLGATVEPLPFDGYNRRHLGSMIGGAGLSPESVFEDPMILIPAMCAILVLLVVGAATAFIFITRSKEALANSEHFCRHRENSRSDQLSLNSFSKNYSKSDLMRSYDTNHKLTEIETLNCGQNEAAQMSLAAAAAASQYVDGPMAAAYLDGKMSDEPNLMEPNNITPGRRVQQQQNAVKGHQESFYSTPCPPGHSGKASTGQYLLTENGKPPLGPYITTTLRKSAPGAGAQCTSMNITTSMDARSAEAIYGDLLNRTAAGPSGQSQVQFANHNSHPYYTHSLITGSGPPGNHPESQHNSKILLSTRESDHVYELPKQQQLNQPFDSKDANNIMMIVMGQQQQQGQQQQGPLGHLTKQQQPSPMRNIRSDMNVPNVRISSFTQNF